MVKIAKYSLENVKDIFEKHNCELITKEYNRNKDILKFKCKCKKIEDMMFKKYLTKFC